MQRNEKNIINTIRYLPALCVLIISSVLVFFLYSENIKKLNHEIDTLEEKYISLNKNLIKFQVEEMKEFILLEKKQKLDTLKLELKNQVLNAHNIAMSIYKNNPDKSKKEIILLVKDALRDIRFNNNRGYIFIYERDGLSILDPINPSYENKNLWHYQDTKGTYLLQNIDRQLIEKDETYTSWYWTKKDDIKKEYEKLGFFKKFEPYNWYIGTGEYISDFKENLKKTLLNKISNYHYKKDAYFFVINYDGTYLNYHNKNIIGKSIYDFKISENTKKIQKQLLELSKSSGGYVSYKHKDKPISSDEVFKISYVSGINDWQWTIGTGFYMDDFYKEVALKKVDLLNTSNEFLIKLIVIAFIVTLLLLGIFIYLSVILEKKLIKYEYDIKKQENENIKKDTLLINQSKLSVMGEMLGNITHQWRQPLSTVSTIVSGIQVQNKTRDKESKLEKDSLDKINKQIKYLSQTIDDFSNFFKPDNEKKIFDISKTIDKALELVEIQLRSNDINLVINVNSIQICSLENELIQVLINLINNAKDELLKIEGKRFIFISCEEKNEKINIIVKDNALGVNEKIKDKIFEAYFTTKNTPNSTGIGLYMSNEIVVKHLDANLNVENESYEYEDILYKGATFSIVFEKNQSKTKESLSLL